jgi:hypothetical protein
MNLVPVVVRIAINTMFVSYEYASGGFDKGYEYRIIDSDFEVIYNLNSFNCKPYSSPIIRIVVYEGCSSVINVYEERKLPVAPNLVKALIFSEKHYYTSIIRTIKGLKHNTKFAQYEKDLEKYLLLI